MYKPKYVEVVWIDANHYSQQDSPDGDFDLATVITAGRLLWKKKKKIAIAMEWIDDNTGESVRNVMVIPRAWIKRIRRLKYRAQ